MKDDVYRSYDEIKAMVSLTLAQINYMKHALGIKRIKGNKLICYRNYFNTSYDEDWEYLVFWGLANKKNKFNYEVSKYGIKLLENILSVKIEMY